MANKVTKSRQIKKLYTFHNHEKNIQKWLSGGPETEDQARLRFQVELEFVQCLANPHYLNFLAQRGYFKDASFINYLKYLLYWKDTDYAKYIKYPICLYFLDLLQHDHFRREIVNSQCAKFIDDQLVLLWQHYTRRRTKLFQTAVESHIQNQNIAQASTSDGVNGSVTAPVTVKNRMGHAFDLWIHTVRETPFKIN